MKTVTWASVPVAASSLLLSLPSFHGYFSPIRVALIRHVLLESGTVLTYLPITTQLAKSAPREGAGVYFALFSSGIEALNLASSVVSSEVTNVLGVTSTNFTNLSSLIVLCTICNIIPLLATLGMASKDRSTISVEEDDTAGPCLPSGNADLVSLGTGEHAASVFAGVRRFRTHSLKRHYGGPRYLDTHPAGVGRNVYKHWGKKKMVKMMHELLLTDYNSELGDVDNEVVLAAKLWAKEALNATRQAIDYATAANALAHQPHSHHGNIHHHPLYGGRLVHSSCEGLLGVCLPLVMWAYDFLRSDPPVARKLITHLRANNVVLKSWQNDRNLPPTFKLRGVTRICRLILYLLIFGAITGPLMSPNAREFGVECERRATCKLGCAVDSFPALSCERRQDL
ncbi:hypothetical protein FOL47_002291, partial [Perkinsus chesapeaki]